MKSRAFARSFAWILAFGATLGPAASQPADRSAAERELRSVERALQRDRERQQQLREESSTLGGEIEALGREMVEAASRIQRREAEATALEAELAQLAEQESETEEWLEARRGQLIGTLGALERMARRPPEALIAMPATPVETVRSALLLRAVVPRLEEDARQLREDVATLKTIRTQAQDKRQSLDAALDDLKRKRTEMAALHSRKNVLRDRAEAERRDVAARVDRLGQEATDLQDLLRRLEAERQAAEAEARRRAAEAARLRAEEQARQSVAVTRRLNEASRDAAERSRSPEIDREIVARAVPSAPVEPPPVAPARVAPTPTQGGLRLPAQGRVVSEFGDGSGPQSRGITIAARAGAQVVAPYEGRVAYAGSFRGYGLLLIIAHGGGYHSLLTGLSRLDSAPGQWVLAGEPVGVMETSGSGDKRLYVELRHNGQPINPIPWLTARKG